MRYKLTLPLNSVDKQCFAHRKTLLMTSHDYLKKSEINFFIKPLLRYPLTLPGYF